MDLQTTKVALVTGAARGIGRACALRFASEGATVCVADLDQSGADETARRVEAAGRKALALQTDTTEEAATALVDFALRAGARIVRAHTRPENVASVRVLAACGFKLLGEVIDPEDGLVQRWELVPSGDRRGQPPGAA